jgi:hypothetical protein
MHGGNPLHMEQHLPLLRGPHQLCDQVSGLTLQVQQHFPAQMENRKAYCAYPPSGSVHPLGTCQ